jgi:hypothetical protein
MRGDVRDRVAYQKTTMELHTDTAKHPSRGVALKSTFANFWRRSIFDFFNTIRPRQLFPEGQLLTQSHRGR